MATAAQDFLGEHDFASFAANRGAPVADTVRTIRHVRVRHSGPRISIELEGDGFLYKMVRLMAGTLVRIGLGMASPNEIRTRLKAPRKVNSHGRSAAPAAGLFLIRVRY
jgi:tRNA pseudouridine38-40 synthase